MKDFFHQTESTGKRTGELTQELSTRGNLSAFLKKNEKEFITPEVGEMLTEQLRRKNITKGELAKNSGMSEVYLYQVLSGRRTPSRDRMICLCFGLQCTLEEAQDLLRKSRFAALYPKVRREAVMMYALEQKWTIHQLNDMLFEIEEETMY